LSYLINHLPNICVTKIGSQHQNLKRHLTGNNLKILVTHSKNTVV